MALHLQTQDVYVQDCFVGTSPKHRMPIRIYAWHNLFARNMFLLAKPEELVNHKPEFHASPSADKTNVESFRRSRIF